MDFGVDTILPTADSQDLLNAEKAVTNSVWTGMRLNVPSKILASEISKYHKITSQQGFANQ